MRVFVLAFLFVAFALGADASPNDPAGPKVLVSIKPAYSIVAAVMQGAGRVEVLLGGRSSPHTHVLSPSDAAEIAHADVIFWIGPALEKFLVGPLANHAPSTRVLAFTDAEGIKLLPARTEDFRDSNSAVNGTGQIDGHIWLDPENAVAIARAAARTLGATDPKHAVLYASNAEAFAERTMLFDALLGEKLHPLRGRPYFVFHDAFQYFEAHYGLRPAGAATNAFGSLVDEGQVRELRTRMKAAGATCILSTSEMPPKIIEALTEGTQVRVVSVEDLGANIPRGTTLYQTLLTRIAATFTSCLEDS